MISQLRRVVSAAVPAAVLVLSAGSARAQSNQFHGAIFTTRADGTAVNQNLFSDRDDVYLNGGPQNDNAAGLPDGRYYFQVTTPNGETLLSSDPAAQRQVLVAGGRIAGAAPVPGAHANGSFNAANGSLPVQLAPFDLTTNNGGEYKVWLIRQDPTTLIDENDPRVLQFAVNDAKTDNFKVEEQPAGPLLTRIGGRSFYDRNANGVREAGELPVPGLRVDVQVTSESGLASTETVTADAAGDWSLEVPSGCRYEAVEQTPGTGRTDGWYWLQTCPAPLADGQRCYAGTASGPDIAGLDFANLAVRPGSGGLTKGFWSNKNGQKLLSGNDPSWRALLNAPRLRTPAGGDFDVPLTAFSPAYTVFRTWILDANAVNMAYMLSAQLAATKLDVGYAGLPGGTLVLSPELGVVSISSVIAGAESALATTGTTFSRMPLRDAQEVLKNNLDAVNNNQLLFVAPSPVGVAYP